LGHVVVFTWKRIGDSCGCWRRNEIVVTRHTSRGNNDCNSGSRDGRGEGHVGNRECDRLKESRRRSGRDGRIGKRRYEGVDQHGELIGCAACSVDGERVRVIDNLEYSPELRDQRLVPARSSCIGEEVGYLHALKEGSIVSSTKRGVVVTPSCLLLSGLGLINFKL
jgi:hypothetical protein